MPIISQMCPASRYGLKCPYIRIPTRIVVHNTGNDAPAINEVSYMINNDQEVSFHAAVDDNEIVQGIPFDRNVWGCGDGHGPGNMEGVHIEICYSKSGGDRFIQAERNAAAYIASLLKQYGWGLDQVTKHQDYNGKYCPHRTLDMGWQRFLNMIQTELDQLTRKEEIDLTAEEVKKLIQEESKKIVQAELAVKTYDTLEDVPSYWREDIAALVEGGVIRGTGRTGEPLRLGLTYSETKMAVIVKRALEWKHPIAQPLTGQ